MAEWGNAIVIGWSPKVEHLEVKKGTEMLGNVYVYLHDFPVMYSKTFTDKVVILW